MPTNAAEDPLEVLANFLDGCSDSFPRAIVVDSDNDDNILCTAVPVNGAAADDVFYEFAYLVLLFGPKRRVLRVILIPMEPMDGGDSWFVDTSNPIIIIESEEGVSVSDLLSLAVERRVSLGKASDGQDYASLDDVVTLYASR